MNSIKFLQNLVNSSHTRTTMIKKNIIGGLAIKGMSLAITFLYVPLLINYLNIEKYGIWVTLTSTMAWFSFFDIGIGNGLRNMLAESVANSDYFKAKKLISTSYAIIGGIFGIVALTFGIINRFIPWASFLNITIIAETELSFIFGIMIILFCIRFIVQLIQPILFALQKAALSALFPVLANMLGFIVVYGLTFTDFPKLLSLTIATSLIPILIFVGGTIYLFTQQFKNLRPAIKYIDLSLARSLLTLGFKFFFLQAAAILINSTSSFIIINIMGPIEVTKYSVAHKYFMAVFMLNSIILSPLWSAFTEALTKKDYLWAKTTIRRMNIISIVFSILVIIMLLISDFIFSVWIGESIHIPFEVSFSLAIYVILRLLLAPYIRFINGTGKLKLSIYINIFNGIIFVIMAYILGKSSLGVSGVVLAACVVRIISLCYSVFQTNFLLAGRSGGIFDQ